MSYSEIDYDKFNGKRVVLVVAPLEEDADATEIEGLAEVVNADGVLIKPKGKTKMDLYEASAIQDIRHAPETPKKLAAKKLKTVTWGQARGHLLERHGYTLDAVNKLTEAEAQEVHDAIDHKAEDLGHFHSDLNDEPAVAEANEAGAEG